MAKIHGAVCGPEVEDGFVLGPFFPIPSIGFTSNSSIVPHKILIYFCILHTTVQNSGGFIIKKEEQ